MLGTWFYWHSLEKCHLAFGTMFNNIELRRYDKLGVLKQTIKVPLEYAPKEKFLARVENTPDLENPNPVQLQYPRMSFIMNNMTYDNTRKLPNNNLCIGNNYNGVPNSYYSHYLPAPYNLSYRLYILVKYREDAAQIIEQIVPYFTPLFNLTVNIIPQIGEQLTFPLVLNNIDQQDDFEGNFTLNPLIIYTLTFTLKANFYGPIVENPSGSGLIKTVNLNFGIQFCKTKATLFYIPEIPLTTPSFDGFYLTDANIDITSSIFTIQNHGFETSDVINFVSEGKRVLPLISDNDYYVFVISPNDFKLCISKMDSINGNFIVLENIETGIVNINEFIFLIMFEEIDDGILVKVEVVDDKEDVKTCVTQSATTQEDIKNDYEQTRKLSSKLAEDAADFATEAMEFARFERTARAYEVATNAIKSAADIAEKLLMTHEKIANINSKKTPEERTEIKSQTNNFFLNTNDLLGRLLDKNQTVEEVEEKK